MTEMPRTNDGSRNIANPDPSPLYTALVLREVVALKELVETRFQGVDIRFVAIDRATELFSDNLVRVPTDVQKAVEAYQLVVDEKFRTIFEQFRTSDEKFHTVDREFSLRDSYTNQSAIDRKEELKTALSAAEKAVDKQALSFTSTTEKSERATLEQIRQQGDLLRSTKEGFDGQLSDLKVRLAVAEQAASSAKEAAATAAATAAALATGQRIEHGASQVDRSFIVTTIGMVIGWLVAATALAIAIFKP